MSEEDIERIAKSKELLFLFITVIGYLVSYFFERAYLSVFQIPDTFVEINIPRLIVSIGFTGLVAVGIATFILRYTVYERKYKNRKGRIVIGRLFLALVILGFILFTLNLLQGKTLITLLVALPAGLLGIFTVELKRTRSFRKTIEVFKDMFKPVNMAATNDNTTVKVPERLVLYVGIGMLSIFVATAAGRMYAAGRDILPVITENHKTAKVIISKNANEVIAKDYDKQNKKFNSGYYVIPIDESLNIRRNLDTRVN